MPLITAIYATPVAIPPVQAAFGTYPDLDVLTDLDEGLLRAVLDDGDVSERCKDRLATHLRLAAEASSDAVLVTCNIYSGALPELRAAFEPLPILAVDEPMVEAAITQYQRIGVLATGASGLASQLELLRDAAEARKQHVDLVPVLCEEAFAALAAAGDAARHDKLLADAVLDLCRRGVEVVVLAQASMARALPILRKQPVPILCSPDLAVAEIHRLVTSAGREESADHGVPRTGPLDVDTAAHRVDCRG